jgi:hypothetical protein
VAITAAVTMMGYLGSFTGPPLIGALAEYVSLSNADTRRHRRTGSGAARAWCPGQLNQRVSCAPLDVTCHRKAQPDVPIVVPLAAQQQGA